MCYISFRVNRLLPGYSIELSMVARSKRHGSGEQYLSRHDRIALRRFESGESETVLRIIGHVEVEVGFPAVQPPQGFSGDRRIRRQGAVRHLGDERRRNR